MKHFFTLFLIAGIFSCSTPSGEVAEAPESSGYDPALAAEVGADQYGMRQYVFAYLKTGPNRDLPQEEADQLQRAHLDNITRLAEEGKLILAGPFMDDTNIRGIYIFAVESLEEAEKLAASDPAIQAGSLAMELHPWYGSAALMKVNEMHVRVAKEGI
ncbi:MAG: YciI family protein [Cytophagales bacterium]|nr:YciI family protein [Cytophagales bacterium]